MKKYLENLGKEEIFTADQRKVIAKIAVLNISGRDKWGHADFHPIYNSAKKKLCAIQEKKCFYCQQAYPHVTAEDWHIDHIVPIDEDERHVFTENNLVLACKGCNRIKNDKPVLTKVLATSKYSVSPDTYAIIHARWDDYSKNMEIVSDRIYNGHTAKGRRTKYECNLDRFNLQWLANMSSDDRDFVEGALSLLLSDNPKQLIGFIKAML